jgi:hypothetical protein
VGCEGEAESVSDAGAGKGIAGRSGRQKAEGRGQRAEGRGQEEAEGQEAKAKSQEPEGTRQRRAGADRWVPEAGLEEEQESPPESGAAGGSDIPALTCMRVRL